jgi:Fic family protein
MLSCTLQQLEIVDKLKNFEEFIHNDQDDIDPLIKLALIHYQFEAIHTFTDGNGRTTGRIINMSTSSTHNRGIV